MEQVLSLFSLQQARDESCRNGAWGVEVKQMNSLVGQGREGSKLYRSVFSQQDRQAGGWVEQVEQVNSLFRQARSDNLSCVAFSNNHAHAVGTEGEGVKQVK